MGMSASRALLPDPEPQRIVLPPGVDPDTYDGLSEDQRRLAAEIAFTDLLDEYS